MSPMPPPSITPPVPPVIAEAVSQNAYSLQTPQQFDQFVAQQPGGQQLTPAQKQTLYGTVEKTRKTHGLPAAPPPATPPKPPVDPNAPPQAPAYNPPAPSATYKAPTPENATYTPAQYKPPAKGLEYIAAGLSLLFGGSQFGRAAGSFAQGLNQGADQKYQRAETQAEQKYKVDESKARTDNEAAQAQAAADYQKAQAADKSAGRTYDVDYKNELQHQQDVFAQYQADKASGKFFKPPPGLDRVLPPGVNRTPTATDFASHYAKLSQAATQQGASGPAKDYAEQAKDYHKQAIDDANNARQIQLTVYREREQDQRQSSREASQDAREANREAAEDRRQDVREAHEDARAARSEGGNKLGTLRDEALRTSKDFYAEWGKAIKTPVDEHGVPRTDAKGNPLPASIPPATAQALSKVFSVLDRDSDPATTAKHYADQLTDPVQKQLLLDRGRAADQYRRSQGRPIVPHAYAAPAKKPEASPSTAPVRPSSPLEQQQRVQKAVDAVKSHPKDQQAALVDSAGSLSATEKEQVKQGLGLTAPPAAPPPAPSY